MALVKNSVLDEGHPVSEPRGLYVDWKGIPTAGGRKRKKEGKTDDTRAVIAEMKVKRRARCPRYERKDRKRRR